MADKWIFK